MRYPCIWLTDFNENWQNYSSREWALPEKLSRSEIQVQGHNQIS